jgi:uroporphyrinogen decarboxylase
VGGDGQNGGPGKALQGNIDPNVLFAPPEAIRTEVRARARQLWQAHTDRDTTGPARTSSTWATASASSPRPSTWRHLVEAVHAHSRARAPEGSVRRLGRG